MFKWLSSTNLNTQVDSLSKAAQVVALFVAAYWTYKTFHKTVEPGLEQRGSITSGLTWSKSLDSDDCNGRLDVAISNDGVNSFNVEHLKIVGYLFTTDKKPDSTDTTVSKPTADKPLQLDLAKIYAGPNFTTLDITDGGANQALVNHYPPSSRLTGTWYFIFKKVKAQGVVFTVDADTQGGQKDQFLVGSYTTDDVCNIPDAASKPS